MLRKTLLLAALLIGAAPLMAAPASATVDHCPEPYLSKMPSPSPDHVPNAGTVLCVKAGTGNTGKITADGTTTLRDYLKAAGIVGGDGEGREPSYAVTYHLEVTEFPTTTTTGPPISTTTTTTTLPVTTDTTTATAPTTTTSAPVSVTPNLGCVTPNGHPYVTNIEQGGCLTPAPTNPSTAPIATTLTTLPETGWDAGLLFVIGTAILLAGLSCWAAGKAIG